MKTEAVRGTYVAPRRTAVAPGALRGALREQLAAQGINANEHTLTALVAMSAHETGEWVSCWNNNLGNVKAAPSWEGEYTCLTNVWEVLNGVTRWFSPRGETSGKGGPLKGEEWAVPPGHPQTRFRAYRTLSEGAVGFVSKMVGMYRPSLEVLLNGGSPEAFVAALKRQRYFTGDLAKYQASVRRFYLKFSGEGVIWYQQILRGLGLYAGKVDGIDGPLTNKAVRAFQSSQALVADGIVGPLTIAALRTAGERLPT